MGFFPFDLDHGGDCHCDDGEDETDSYTLKVGYSSLVLSEASKEWDDQVIVDWSEDHDEHDGEDGK